MDRRGTADPTDRAAWALIGLWALIGAASLLIWRNFTVDDAFIGWRHGLNLIQHGVYAFNPVGERVEAATSPSYGLLAAVPVLLGIDVVVFFKLLTLGGVVGFVALATRVAGAPGVGTILTLTALAGPIQAIHLWSGLETGLFVLLSAGLALYAIGRLELRPWAVGALGWLLVLTRQEGAFMVCAVVWLRYLGPGLGRRGEPFPWRTIFRRFLDAAHVWAPPLAAVSALTLWRWCYFGSFLPNTFATKTGEVGGDLSVILTNSGANVAQFAPVIAVALVPPFLMDRLHRGAYFTLALWSGLPSVLLYLPSELVMTYAYRFPYQALWPIVIAGVTLLAGPLVRRVAVGMVCTLAPAMLLAPGGDIGTLGSIDYYPRMTSAMLPLGEALKGSGQPGVLVMGDTGQTPFVSGWQVLDTNFLGTPSAFGVEGIVQQIEGGGRTVLALYAGGPDPGDLRESEEVYRAAAVRGGYSQVCSIQWRGYYWFQIWVSPEAGGDEPLVGSLSRACDSSAQANATSLYRESVFGWYWRT